MTERVCKVCGGPLPPEKTLPQGGGPRRKFCSERCRKTQYDLVCTVCGGRASGADPGRMADRTKPVCVSCAAEHYAHWTTDAIVAAIRAWTAKHGRFPSVQDFQRARYHSSEHVPTENHVIYRFGSWRNALQAAGYDRPPRRGPSAGFKVLTPEQRGDCARRYAAGESSVAIAADLGCSPRVVLDWARRAGVEIRPRPFGDRKAAA
jgi:hypothetical protein